MKCLLCQKKGWMSQGLEVYEVLCKEHHELLRKAEEQNNLLKKLYETRTREVRGIEKLD